MAKTLIAFFSHSGSTRAVAKEAALLTGGDLFEIAGAEPYPEKYALTVAKSLLELRRNARPELREPPGDLSGYDTVVLGYPCWCGTMPMPVWTFLESAELSGKKLLPFCSNGGSGMGVSEKQIAALCPGAALRPGLSVIGAAFASAGLAQWLKNNGII